MKSPTFAATKLASILMLSSIIAQPLLAHDHYINDPILPPTLNWNGSSQSLLIDANHQWATHFEQHQYVSSPSYQDTFIWFDKLITSSPLLEKVSLGKSPQGHDIWMIIASKEGANTPEKLTANQKPTLLVQAGIHSGEIDGKDAGMMLLRDIAHLGKAELLDNANLIFIPILSVDGHERVSEFNRVNQRGPTHMGWRTQANNLNLNRDYAKADALEMQHLLGAINTWNPDLYIDVHVTDGIDYQYDVTFGYNVKQGYSPAIFNWLDSTYRQEIEQALTAQGHIPGPLVFANDNADMSQGLSYWNASARYSNGYGDARHLPTILIENHSLKPFKQRVLGTYVMMEQSLKTLGQHKQSLKAAIKQDSTSVPNPLTLTWKSEAQTPWDFKGVDYVTVKSDISGADVVRWTGKPKLYSQLPVTGNTLADIQVTPASAYYIPAQWQAVIEKLRIHGIEIETLTKPVTLELEQYHFNQPKFNSRDYEGRQTVSAVATSKTITTTLPKGTIKVSTDQGLGTLASLLLEPQAEDSLFYWGMFNTIFTRTEYIEDYAVEPMARAMLKSDPTLKADFEKALKDESFANDSKARLRWFYERSPYYDSQYLVYPVLREVK